MGCEGEGVSGEEEAEGRGQRLGGKGGDLQDVLFHTHLLSFLVDRRKVSDVPGGVDEREEGGSQRWDETEPGVERNRSRRATNSTLPKEETRKAGVYEEKDERRRGSPEKATDQTASVSS